MSSSFGSSSSSRNQESESMSNDSNPNWIYDVFLSFCDKDTGVKSFASYLHTALTVAGVVVFRDDDQDQLRIRRDRITPSAMHAMRVSKISIVIFSTSYAESTRGLRSLKKQKKTRCLQEFERIMECYRSIGQMVVSVFYDVDPSTVLHHQGEAFRDLKQRILKMDEASSNIFTVDSRNASKGVKNVVQHTTHLLEKTYLHVADYPVGVESRVREVFQQLNTKPMEHTALVGIVGETGVGKTTIAKAIYNQIGCSFEFEAKSFLLNVDRTWNQNNGCVSLQRKLLSDIDNKTTKVKMNTNGLKSILKERLLKRRILLVLDDVSDVDQFYALCGSCKSFAEGSRIIITTRYIAVLRHLNADHDPAYQLKPMESLEFFSWHEYLMQAMDKCDSLQLFSWHAFNQPSPSEGFADLSKGVVKYCGGFPLDLELTGSFLATQRRNRECWEGVLNNLRIAPTKYYKIHEILRLSFDELMDDEVKAMFLDIALNLVGMNQDDVIQILKDSGYNSAETGISFLVQQSLVTVEHENRIEMHDLIREYGKLIIREKSTVMDQERVYDVFLSFRGEDTRTKFTSHLHSALQNAGVYVFKDDDEIPRGDNISVSLFKAIGLSRICIVVLSENYANSRWCMLELENIMEISGERGMVVLPVFYEVDPSEVRHQTGRFGKGFKHLISQIPVDEARKRKWETSLLQVGSIAGVVIINSRNESVDIRNVVDHVTNFLDMKDLFVADHPVGVESRVKDVIKLLNNQQSKDTLLLGIWGMGGIGKTTIAKAAYNEIRRDFEAKSFLLNVREVWEQDNGKVSLQQRLLSDIYKTTKIKIDTVESGKMILKERLRQKRIFLVLDDLNKLDQLNALCESREWFGPGSRIIITTRDDDLLDRLKADHVYRMNEMEDNESLELFSWHAFKQPSPNEGFADISRGVVKYCGGLPLALQVIGSFLLTRRRKVEWKSVLEKLKLIPNNEVLEKLRISFDGLSDDDMKEIFLDIAFFFIGMDQEDVTKILKDCGHFADIGISVLVQQSLITVDRKNKIRMHDLLRDMGREIVRKNSIERGKEPSRLWRYEEVHTVLSKDARAVDVKGLTLKMSRMNSTTYLKTEEFEKMDRLRLLQLAGVQLDGHYKYLSRELRWLSWHGFPSNSTPPDFHQGRLVAIDLKYSNLQRVWKKSQFLKELKILNLSHSHDLRETPDFSNLPNLEKLILKDCPSLSSVSSTIGHLKRILLINLKDCTGLRELPRSIYKLESVKTLIVSGCTKIDKLEEDIEQMKSLTTLVADKTAITRVPLAVVRSKSIAYISLCGYEGFSRNVFPSIIQSWMSPTNNILSLVQTPAGTSSFDSLDEQNDSFYGLSATFKDIQNLQRLWLECDSEAQLNQIQASILDNLYTTGCEAPEAMQKTPQSSNIATSASIECRNQVQISSSENSSTSLLIQLGMNCHATNILRENISQNMPPMGSGILPDDSYPDWLTFTCKGSSVTFEVPRVDGRNLKTIMCVIYSSCPGNIASDGLKVVLVKNCTKNTIQLYKRNALLASFDEGEWHRVVSNVEPGNKMEVIVVFGKEFTVKKTMVYLVYDELMEEKTRHCADENIFGRLFFTLPSRVQSVLTSQPFWFWLAAIMVCWSCYVLSNKV